MEKERLNIYSDMQHWLGKMQDALGVGAIVAVSSSTKAGLLNIMVNWYSGKDRVCSPFIAKWTIAELAQFGQDDITGTTIRHALQWKSNQGKKPKEIANVDN